MKISLIVIKYYVFVLGAIYSRIAKLYVSHKLMAAKTIYASMKSRFEQNEN